LLDWEPQGSLTYWWTVRGKPDNPALIPLLNGKRIVDPAEAISRSDADWLFLDTAPAMLTQVERAIEAADYVLIPLLASALDMMAARTVVSICGDHGKPFGFVLTKVHSQRETLNTSSGAHLRKLGVLLSPSILDRASYVSTMAHGKSAAEHPDARQRKEAREEIEALWAVVRKAATKAAGGK
jgi:chromosome partitioning protein